MAASRLAFSCIALLKYLKSAYVHLNRFFSFYLVSPISTKVFNSKVAYKVAIFSGAVVLEPLELHKQYLIVQRCMKTNLWVAIIQEKKLTNVRFYGDFIR